MSVEIERKFLVKNWNWKRELKGIHYRQGYLNTDKERVVRVRTIDDKAFLTIKGKVVGISRLEFEYEIPYKEAQQLLDNLCEKPLIDKHRYKLPIKNGLVWEIDEFHAENEGLVVAEIELASEEQAFPRPNWLGKEISGNPKYYNSNLIKYPFSMWE